ncbi:hypothetical protein C5S31_01620 [ANME-1 cluster archaeon GoMg2]|nr:hypothetical protein [ANME-1 cluster archaeon GoMg2]
MTLKPAALKSGDVVGVYSPSSGIEPEIMDNYKRGYKYLQDWEIKIIEAPNTFEWQGHYSALGDIKALDFHYLLNHHDVKAIIPSVGGGSAIHMLPYLNFTLIKDKKKMIFGFSDNSIPAAVITSKTGLVTFHGHSDICFGFGDLATQEKRDKFIKKGNYTEKQIRHALFGKIKPGPIEKASQWSIIRGGYATGPLLGGTINALVYLLGTGYDLAWTGTIFYWEAAFTQIHLLDQILAQFRLNGVFDRINGMVIGKPDNVSEDFFQAKFDSFEKVVKRHTSPYDFPVLMNADIGHDMECCMLPNGIRAEIVNDEIILLESPYEKD